MSRTENSIRNLKYGAVYQAVDVALKFAMRTAMVYALGDAVVGLNGLFNEVLGMLSLAEMGVGSAILYSLYKPLAEGDEAAVRRLMALFRRAYQAIAALILALGLCCMPFVHLLVRKVDFSVGYIRLIYGLYLMATSASYLFSYKAVLFNADQKTYRVTRVKLAMDVLWTGLKTVSVLLFHNFVVFLALDVAGQISRNALIGIAANRAYPYLREKAELPDKAERKAIFGNIRHIFVGKATGTLVSSTDNMFISGLDSTLSVGFYSNYAMIINNARTFLLQVPAAAVGGIGNLLATDLPRCYGTLKRMTMLMYLIGSVVCVCFYTQLTPLVSAWLGPERALSGPIVGVLVLNLMLYALREPLWQFLSAAGLFKKDRNLSLIGSGLDIALSFGLGIPFGMLGIFCGTAITILTQYALKARLLCREKLGLSSAGFLGYSALLLGATALAAGAAKWACGFVATGNAWLDILAGLALSALTAVLVSCLLFWRTKEMRYCLDLARKYARRALKKGS